MKTSGRKTVKDVKTSAPMMVKASAGAAVAAVAARSTAARTPSYEEIARRSYELYLARGSVDGHHVEDWLAAEAELRGT
jgi:hypothetical protein